MKIYQELAKGFRNNFRGIVKSNLKNFFSKLNSRQSQVVQHLLKTLSSFFYCISIREFYEEIKEVNKHRNKDQRKNLIVFATTYFNFLLKYQR